MKRSRCTLGLAPLVVTASAWAHAPGALESGVPFAVEDSTLSRGVEERVDVGEALANWGTYAY